MFTRTLIAGLTSAVLLSACSETSSTGPTTLPGTTAMRTGSQPDEKACLDAVKAQANNSVTVLSSDFSEANTVVMVGVGSERAPWRCLVSNGIVAEAMFAGSEGKL